VLSLITLGLAASGCVGIAPDVPVTYTTKAALMPRVLDDISKASGVRLEASAKVASDVLIVNVKSVPVTELMKQIADVDHAQWETTKVGFRLVRTDTLEAKLRGGIRDVRARDFDRIIEERITSTQAKAPFDKNRARLLASQLEEALKGISSTSPTFEAYNVVTAMSPKLPVGRGIDRILAAIGGKELATLPEARRVVYGLPATRMQRTLPANALREVDEIIRESSLWADALKATSINEELLGKVLPVLHSPLSVRPAKLNLIITRTATTIQAQLRLYDDNGFNTHQALSFLRPTAGPKSSFEAEPNEPDIVYSDASKQIVEVLKGIFERTEPAPLPDSELRQALLNPETTDPLSFVMSEALLQTASDRNKNLVATVPDGMFAGPYNVLPQTSSLLVKGLNDMGFTTAVADGWITVKPRDPFRMWEARANRSALGELMRSAAKDSRVSLEAWLRFAPTCRTAEWQTLPSACATLLLRMPVLPWELRMAKLVGLLTPSQRKLAESGIEVRRLDPIARDLVREFAYGTDQGVSMDRLEQPTETERRFAILFDNGIYREPTEAMPDGLPADATLTIASLARDVAYEVGKRMYERPMDPIEMAMGLFFKEHPEKNPNAVPRNFDRLNMGQIRQISVELRFTTQLALTRHLEDNVRDYSKVYAFKDLPAEFRRSVEECLARLRGDPAKPPAPKP
jgi:hypothetical protein